MRQTSIRNDIRLFIAQGYHWVDMTREFGYYAGR